MTTLPTPQYTVWQAVSAALAAALRAIEEVRALARQPGPQGERGERGKDGFSLSDFSVTSPDGGRTLFFKFSRGDMIETSEIKTDIVLYRGVWKEGSCAKGDGVTLDGSFWIAHKDTDGRPGVSPDWRLAVKRGRDGKSGKDGKDGIIGPKGDRGDQGPRGFGS